MVEVSSAFYSLLLISILILVCAYWYQVQNYRYVVKLSLFKYSVFIVFAAVVSLLVSLPRDAGKHARRSTLRLKFAFILSNSKKNLQGLRSLPVLCVEFVVVAAVAAAAAAVGGGGVFTVT